MNRNSNPALAVPPLDINNWAASLLAMEEHAIFRCGWEPSQAAYAVERLSEAGEAMETRGEVVGPARMSAEAMWCMFSAWGEVWTVVNAGGCSAPDLQPATQEALADIARLSALRDDMAVGMAKLEEIPERAAYAYGRMQEMDISAKRRLPLDHPDYVSAGAMFRLTMAYGEVWDSFNGSRKSH